ncbi:MAG: hypothetical protein ACLFUC_00655 [Bacteroidales bacterium]
MKTRKLFKPLLLLGMVMFLGVSAHAQGTYPGDMAAHTEADSVTVGSTMEYFVMPDINVSPDYDFATDPQADLNSTFTWSTDAGHTINDVEASNYVEVVWDETNGTGSYTLEVTETATAGSCADATPTSIPVNVIGVPTGGFDHATYTDAVCDDDPATVSFNFPVALTTDVADGDVTITYSVYNNTTSTEVVTNAQVTLDKTDTELTFDAFTEYGEHVITIGAVTDRIATKSNVSGTINAGADMFTFTINRIPETGTIYHVPNR